MMKNKIWHKWVEEITDVGEIFTVKDVKCRLVEFRVEKKTGLLYIPNSMAIGSYFNIKNNYENTTPKASTVIWKKVK